MNIQVSEVTFTARTFCRTNYFVSVDKILFGLVIKNLKRVVITNITLNIFTISDEKFIGINKFINF